jgi:hypothetical protein
VAKSKRKWPDLDWSEIRRSDIETLLGWVEEVTGVKEEQKDEAEGREAYAKAQAAAAHDNWQTLDDRTKASWVRFAKNEKSSTDANS